MLALGLVVLRIWGGGITSDIEGYLFGNLLLIDYDDLDLILVISILSLVSLFFLHDALLATTVDAISARVQGIPTRWLGLWFSAAVAAIVVSMVLHDSHTGLWYSICYDRIVPLFGIGNW